MSEIEKSSEMPEGISRRRAIKVGTAATVGAAVWSEPTINGLARRPAYAAANSTLAPVAIMNGPINFVPPPSVINVPPVVISLTAGPADEDSESYILTPTVTDCVCSWDVGLGGSVELSNGSTTVVGTHPAIVEPLDLTFLWPLFDLSGPVSAPTTITFTDTNIECRPQII